MVLAFCFPALADSIRLKNLTHKDVKIVGMRDGEIYFKTASGDDRSVALDDVRGLEVDKYPNLGKANEAFAKEDFAGAAKLLAPVFDTAKEDYVKVLAGVQLVAALERSGNFLDASRRYAKLLAFSSSDLVKSAAPTSLPAAPADRAAAAEKLAADLKTTSDPLAKKFLADTIAGLKADASAPAPVANKNTPDAPKPKPKAGLLATDQDVERDPIDEALNAGKHEAALGMVDEQLKGEGGSVPKLLYQRGKALAALGRENDAILAYMRVVIHFSPRSGPQYGQSLVEAGRLRAKQGRPAEARKLWTDAKAVYKPDTDEAKQVEALLAELPAG